MSAGHYLNIIRKSDVEVHPKKWGEERWIWNDALDFCAKVLIFNKGNKTCSMHHHVKKFEVWYVATGNFLIKSYNTELAIAKEYYVGVGDVILVPRGVPHQIIGLEPENILFEASTPHEESDSYRTIPGDSQK